uniref:PUL domain-containing protein n=1 Tax=Ciona savignyi TaxID=51511 RepID=H2Z8D7_CIOSA
MDTLVHISSAIQTLLIHSDLVEWFVSIGVLHALGVLLNIPTLHYDKKQYTVLTESLNSLKIIAKTSDDLKLKVANTSCLSAALQLCSERDASISLVAATVVSLIAQHPRTHDQILAVPNVLRTILFKVSNSADDQITEQMLKILEVLSRGNNEIKHSITAEDAACGGVLAKVFQSN